jgi:hypothetical protein
MLWILLRTWFLIGTTIVLPRDRRKTARESALGTWR